MIHHGDLFDVLPTLEAESLDACVTDPPYGIAFMNKAWDNFSPSAAASRIVPNRSIESDNPNLKGRVRGPASSPSAVEYNRSLEGQRGFQAWTERWAREVLRVLKPGAHLVVCGAPRSFHRMTCGLEDAGFEIRDCLSWLYGQGFPKSLNIGNGQGTALKPGWEPIVLARKPIKTSVAENVRTHRTGCLQIDACRVGDADTRRVKEGGRNQFPHEDDSWEPKTVTVGSDLGRWPANVILDEEAAAMLDAQAPFTGAAGAKDDRGRHHGIHDGRDSVRDDVWGEPLDERSGASRFYYVPKPSRAERDYGCDGLEERQRDESRQASQTGGNNPRNRGLQPRTNSHPTVKPVELMRWLVKLVTPIGGTVLDPFMGSGTTGMACLYEQRQFIGIEREADYVRIAECRIAAVAPLFSEQVVNE